MADLKPIQPSPTELLARQVQQLATLNAQMALMLAELTAAVKALHGVQQTRIVNLNMPFFDLVGFIVKASLAAIPAAVIMWVLALLVAGMLGASCAALLGR